MKKFTTILTAAILLISASAFATNGDNVTTKVKTAFSADFTNASSVTWKKSSDFYFASFTVSGIEFNAAYNEDGELVGVSKEISSAQLPLSVTMAVSKKYAGYNMLKYVTEITLEGQTRYYVTVVNNKQAIHLKCDSTGEINVESRTKG